MNAKDVTKLGFRSLEMHESRPGADWSNADSRPKMKANLSPLRYP